MIGWMWSVCGVILTGGTEVHGEDFSQLSFVQHKSYPDYPGIEPGLRDERAVSNRVSHGTAYVEEG